MEGCKLNSQDVVWKWVVSFFCVHRVLSISRSVCVLSWLICSRERKTHLQSPFPVKVCLKWKGAFVVEKCVPNFPKASYNWLLVISVTSSGAKHLNISLSVSLIDMTKGKQDLPVTTTSALMIGYTKTKSNTNTPRNDFHGKRGVTHSPLSDPSK